ncbi:MAG: TonB-dependent receptor [Bacteroidales bacterium]
MINRLLAVLFLFSFLACKTSYGQGIVKGRVFDRQTMEPLPSASVLYGKGQGTVTDRTGFYTANTSTGRISITFRYVGYASVTRTVHVPPGDTVILDVGLEYDAAEIDQIVISAGKVEQRVSELTVSVNIIKPGMISSSHITDPTELINKTPGIEVLDGQASVRGGSGFSYGAGSRVIALIDGLPVLSADAGNIKWQFLPLENISQIEIIKGASSVLYGSSALNGVINFRTAEAGSEPVTRFFSEAGVFGRPGRGEWVWWDSPRTWQSASFSHMQRYGNTGMSVALHLLNDNGYRKLNDEKLGRLNLSLKHDDERFEGLSYGVSMNAGITGKRDFILWENAWSGALKQDESTANKLNGSLITIDPYISMKSGTRYMHDLRTRLQSSGNRFPEAGQNDSRALSFLAEYQFRYTLSRLVDINLGIMENYSRIYSALYGDHHAFNLAGYTQAEIAPVERLKVVAGIRIEHNTLDGLWDRLVPLFRAGVNYRLLDYTFLRASFGQGYRYPSIAEKHAATTMGSVRIVPNPDIRPESGWSSELGIKQGILTGRLNGQLDIAVFHSRNKDMIEYLFYFPPRFMATNVEHSRVYGTEIEFALSGPAGRFNNTVTGGYVFIYPVEVNSRTAAGGDVYLKYRRKHSVTLSLGSEYGRYDFGFSLQAGSPILNIDDVFLNELTRETILPGFYDYWNESVRGHLLVDPHIGYAINEKLRMSMVVKNVLNTEYMGRPGDIRPHRNFSMRLTGNF